MPPSRPTSRRLPPSHRLPTAWRLVVAASAFTGVLLAAMQYDVWWTALSQLGSLAVGASYVGFAVGPRLTGRPEPRSSWLHGALATLMVLVSVAFLVMQHGNLWDPYSVFEHLLTPALVVADFALVSGNRARVAWWHPLTWALVPVPYLGWYVAGDLGVYAALDLDRPLAFAGDVTLLLALLLVAGYTLRSLTSSMSAPGDRVPLLARQ